MQANNIIRTIFFLLLLSLTSCEKDSSDPAPSTPAPTGPGANEVWMQNNTFNPSSITVAAGTTITWTNKDNTAHTVTSNDGLFNSGNISAGSTFSRQFTSAGTISYHCTLHSGMNGTVVVQ